MMAYRSSMHASPCLMMLGREISLPIYLCFERLPDEEQREFNSEYLYNLEEKLEKNEYARNNYENRMKFKKYEQGDAVWLHNLSRKKGISPKLQDHGIDRF